MRQNIDLTKECFYVWLKLKENEKIFRQLNITNEELLMTLDEYCGNISLKSFQVLKIVIPQFAKLRR